MNFESELKKGNFMISECKRCKRITWPPSEICDQCFGNTVLRKSSGKGKIIEFSKKDQAYFCIAEIEDSVRVFGQIESGFPKIGDSVSIAKCGLTDKNMQIRLKILH